MTNALRHIQTFEALIPYLEDELDWPLQQYGFDDLTFEYTPAELGLKDEDAVKISRIHQLRPLQHGQPWGIFFVEFEKKRLPVVVLRRVLSHLVVKKRASANRADAAAWQVGDLLFISAYGDSAANREIAFAHFHQEGSELPTLRVLGWDGGDTPLKLEHVAATLREKLSWPDDPHNHDAWRATWTGAFRHRLGHVIRTADALAEALAALARRIRDAALLLLAHETEEGALHTLYKAFQTALIHDLSEADFADTYAQTITYGLLTAAISRTDMNEAEYGTALIAENVADIVPVTNPFLKEMLQTFLQVGGRKGGIDFDELGIQDVVELLRGDETDLPAILRDFGNKTQGEDPVIHFYEHFLAAYDKKLKVQRGVFYTPKPVVSYIVRSVHELLQTEFGLADGLADTTTWGEMAQRQPDLNIPEGTDPNSAFVVILDPATGTATFLVEVVDVIHRTMTAKWREMGMNEAQRKAAWNAYVPRHLLPRLYGYELMMAPYAIAHMKVSLKLKETGFTAWSQLGPTDRLRIYLTNALEPANDQLILAGILPMLAHEAHAVNAIKLSQQFTVAIGNPPYSNYGQLNRIPFILDLLNLYKQNLAEKKINLDDDFIKFTRFAHWLITKAGIGCLGFITNNAYLDGITHRQMRRSLLDDFQIAYFTNLHGDSRKGEIAPDGKKDENVFDIQQGVAVTVLVRKPFKQATSVNYQDMWGERSDKYTQLMSSQNEEPWLQLQASSPYFFVVPKDFSGAKEYEGGISVRDIFQVMQNGIKTDRDSLFFDFDQSALETRMKKLYSNEFGQDFRDEYNVYDSSSYDLLSRVSRTGFDPGNMRKCLYRPFDQRWLYYAVGITSRPAWEVMKHMIAGKNLSLITTRQTKFEFSVLCAGGLSEKACANSLDINTVIPLYLYGYSDGGTKNQLFDNHWKARFPNLSTKFLSLMRSKLSHMQFLAEGRGNLSSSFGTEDIFDYIYAVFHSLSYRQRYAEFLKIDFPRVPLTSSPDLFHALVQLGEQLVVLHLVEFALEDEAVAPADWPRYPCLVQFSGGNRVIEKFPAAKKAWQDSRVAINGSSGFIGIPEEVWNFYIGGYQVCHKWLKDRKGRTLSDADILHYCKIVTALHETIRIMAEIDEVIEEHGGWPIQ